MLKQQTQYVTTSYYFQPLWLLLNTPISICGINQPSMLKDIHILPNVTKIIVWLGGIALLWSLFIFHHKCHGYHFSNPCEFNGRTFALMIRNSGVKYSMTACIVDIGDTHVALPSRMHHYHHLCYVSTSCSSSTLPSTPNPSPSTRS